MSKLMPLFLDLSARTVVIFGGGRVGERKARLFSEHAQVKVISKEFTAGLVQMGKDGSVELVMADLSGYFEDYLQGAFIAIPATSDRDLNRSIQEQASRLGVLVNKVDGVGDIVVPSILKKDPITVAISTESPALSKYLRQRLEKDLQGNYSEMARLLGGIRQELKDQVKDQEERSRMIWSILEDREVWRLLDVSYEKAYMRAREHAPQYEPDSLDVDHPPQGLH